MFPPYMALTTLMTIFEMKLALPCLSQPDVCASLGSIVECWARIIRTPTRLGSNALQLSRIIQAWSLCMPVCRERHTFSCATLGVGAVCLNIKSAGVGVLRRCNSAPRCVCRLPSRSLLSASMGSPCGDTRWHRDAFSVIVQSIPFEAVLVQHMRAAQLLSSMDQVFASISASSTIPDAILDQGVEQIQLSSTETHWTHDVGSKPVAYF